MEKMFKIAKGKKNGLALCAVAALSISLLAGCAAHKGGSSNVSAAGQDTNASQQADDGTASKDVTKVKFASGTSNWPFCYVDDNGSLSGFEYDVIREVDKLLDEYEFELVSTEWEDMLTSVQLGKLNIASWTIKKTPEREQEFLFADEWVTTQKFYLVVGANNDEIHSLDDLQGATVDGSHPNEYIYTFWENYIAEHPEQNINLIASGNPLSDAGIEALQNGSTDAIFMDDITVAGQIEKRGKVMKILGEPLSEVHGYYVYNKKNTELKEAVDGAIIELKENGTYDALYEKWFSFLDDLEMD